MSFLDLNFQLLLILSVLAPRQNRPCFTLAWNIDEPGLLAMGFEKNKFDHGVTVWDISRGIPSESSIVQLIGLSETAHSMCWDKKTLIAGNFHKTKVCRDDQRLK